MNRQDRRYAAKLARQAAKRGKTPAERTLLGAAVAYSGNGSPEFDFTLPGFDEAWRHLESDLRDILDLDFDEFRRDVFAESAWSGMVASSRSGEEHPFELEPHLFPVTGSRRDILAFAAEPKNLDALAASLLASGVISEENAIAILPVVLTEEATDMTRVGPAAVSRLTADLAGLFQAEASGTAGTLAVAESAIRNAELPLVAAGEEDDSMLGFLFGIRLARPENWDLSEEEAEARYLAMAATRASWLDTYAADLPFRLGPPMRWYEASASLAWHAVLGEIEAELARRGITEPVTRFDAHFPETGDAVLVARCGSTLFGPFHAAGALVAVDLAGFAEFAEHYAGELIEHENAAAVLRLLRS